MDITDIDQVLLKRIANKDFNAYRQLISRHLSRCVRFAERIVGNRQEAEDIVQTVCLKIWNDTASYRPQAKFTTWLYRVLINACIDHKRKHARIVLKEDGWDTIEDERPSAEEEMLRAERSKQVQQALRALGDQQRAAVVLTYFEEMSNQQAADTLNLSLGAFQQLLFRARQNLKTTLQDNTRKVNHG